MITLPSNHDNVIVLSWQGYYVIMVTLSWYHERDIILSWQGIILLGQVHHIIMTGLSCYSIKTTILYYHDNVFMVYSTGIWQGHRDKGFIRMMTRLQCCCDCSPLSCCLLIYFFPGPDQLENPDVLFYQDFSKNLLFWQTFRCFSILQSYTLSPYRFQIPVTYGYISANLAHTAC
jgi:hypothetical protein